MQGWSDDLITSEYSGCGIGNYIYYIVCVLTSSENGGLTTERKTIHTFYRRPIKLLMSLLQVCYSIVQSIILDT